LSSRQQPSVPHSDKQHCHRHWGEISPCMHSWTRAPDLLAPSRAGTFMTLCGESRVHRIHTHSHTHIRTRSFGRSSSRTSGPRAPLQMSLKCVQLSSRSCVGHLSPPGPRKMNASPLLTATTLSPCRQHPIFGRTPLCSPSSSASQAQRCSAA
jgi:hypothetical protein